MKPHLVALRTVLIGILGLGWACECKEHHRTLASQSEAVEAAVLTEAHAWQHRVFAKDAEITRLSQVLEDERAGRAAAAQHMAQDWALHEAALRDALEREKSAFLVQFEQRWLKLEFRDR